MMMYCSLLILVRGGRSLRQIRLPVPPQIERAREYRASGVRFARELITFQHQQHVRSSESLLLKYFWFVPAFYGANQTQRKKSVCPQQTLAYFLSYLLSHARCPPRVVYMYKPIVCVCVCVCDQCVCVCVCAARACV